MENDERPKLSPHQKALKINLDPMFYGTFAEIGAGQEVARWFSSAGVPPAVLPHDIVTKFAGGTPALPNPTRYNEARDHRTNHSNRGEISRLAVCPSTL